MIGSRGQAASGISRRDMLHRLGALSALVAAPGIIAGCASDGATSRGPSSAGVDGVGSEAPIPLLTWALADVPQTLDIATGNSEPGLVVMANALEGLLTYSADLKLEPLLATRWTQPDPLTYTYTIRQGVTFWDGTPMTVDDVVYSMARHMEPDLASQISAFYANVKSIRATGPDEVTVSMKAVDPLFQYVPVFTHIVSEAMARPLGRRLGLPGPTVSILGTGPLKITAFNGETGAEAERNDRYWGVPAKVEKVSFRVVSDPNTRRLAVQSGEVDGCFGVPADAYPQWERLDNVALGVPEGLRVAYLSFDLDQEPWNDIHVRRAVAYAADTAGYASAFFGATGQPASALPAPAQWGQLLPADEVAAIYAAIPSYPYDMQKARDELAQSAHPNGFAATVEFSNKQPANGKMLVALADSLRSIGIDLQVTGVTQSDWLDGLFAHTRPLGYWGLGPDYPDPANYLTLAYPSSAAVKGNYNTAHFRDPHVDELLARQGTVIDGAERGRILGEVLRIAGEQLPYLPLVWQPTPVALNRKFVFSGFNALYYNSQWLAGVRVRA
jgi:peptide/nickel transport system substrate-binding protein